MSKKLSKRDDIDTSIGCLLLIVMVVSGILFIYSGFLADFEWRRAHVKLMVGSCFFFFLALAIFILIVTGMNERHILNGTDWGEEDDEEEEEKP